MGDASDDYDALVVINGVHDPVLADSNPVIIAAGELGGPDRLWMAGKGIDCSCDPIADRTLKTPIRPSRLRVETDLILMFGRAAYVRTSDQEREWRSSRAWRAARLSSRYSSRSISSA